MQGREWHGAWCFQTSNYTQRVSIHFKNCSLNNFFRQVPDTGHCARGVAIPRSSCPEQWYLLRRQRDVTDRELALWPRGGRGVGERGDTRWKRERRNSRGLFVYRCSLSKHMVRRRDGPSLQCLKIYYIPSNTRKCTIISTIDTSLRESSSSFFLLQGWRTLAVTRDDPL